MRGRPGVGVALLLAAMVAGCGDGTAPTAKPTLTTPPAGAVPIPASSAKPDGVDVRLVGYVVGAQASPPALVFSPSASAQVPMTPPANPNPSDPALLAGLVLLQDGTPPPSLTVRINAKTAFVEQSAAGDRRVDQSTFERGLRSGTPRVVVVGFRTNGDTSPTLRHLGRLPASEVRVGR